jgi:hypothetical protein
VTDDDAPLPYAAGRPSVLAAFRHGLSDVFYGSWRIVPVNLVWGIWFIVVLFAWTSLGLLAALLLTAPLGVPVAGLARLGGLATREAEVTLGDALDPIRRRPRAVIAASVGFALGALILVVNVTAGLAMGDTLGIVVVTTSGWGLVGLLGFALTFWPLLTDPARDGVPAPTIARLAGLMLLARPGGVGALVGLVVLVIVLSAAVVVPLLTVSVGFVMAAATRWVLPSADRVEERLAGRTAG